MNTTLSTRPGRLEQQHPPIPGSRAPQRARRVSTIDRIALHVGLALVVWSRRPRVVVPRALSADRIAQQHARIARERSAERALRLIAPPR